MTLTAAEYASTHDSNAMQVSAAEKLEQVVPQTPQKVWSMKFMSQITFPRHLYDKAQNELQNPTFVFPAGNANAGQPSSIVASVSP